MKNKNNLFESCFYVMSLILLISIPFGYFLSSLAFGVWFVFCLFYGINNKLFELKKGLLPILIFSFFSFFSLIWSQDQPQTYNTIGRQLPLLLFPIAGMCIPSLSLEKLKRTFISFSFFLSVFAIIMVMMAIIKYNKYQYRGFLYYHELVSPLKLNAIYISYIFSTFFLVILSLLEKKEKKLFPMLIILGAFLLMLSSKTVIVVTVFLAVVILALKIKQVTHKLIILGLVLLGLFVAFKYAKPIQNRFSTEFNTSVTEIFNAQSFKKGRAYTGLEARLLQIRVFKEIIDTPDEIIFGIGLGASKKEVQKIHKKLNTPESFQTYNLHNQYIQVFAELGLIGFMLLLSILAVGFKKSLKATLFLPFIIITIALFFTEVVIWRQRGIMFFGIMYILLIRTNWVNESKKSISKV